MRRLLLLASLMFWVQLVGCDHNTNTNRHEIQYRFIPEDTGQLIDPATAWEAHSVFKWGFEDATDLEDWTLHHLEVVPPEAAQIDEPDRQHKHLILRATQSNSRLVRASRFAADDVDFIELKLGGTTTGASPNSGYAQIFWANRGNRFSDKNSLSVALKKTVDGRYRFDMSKHAGWTGKIVALRIDPTSMQNVDFSIESIEGYSYRASPAALELALSRPWKVDLWHEVRSSLPSPPGVEIQHEVELGDDPKLVFGYGLEPTLTAEVEFQVQIITARGKVRELFRETTTAADGWRDAEVDLSPWAGQTVELLLNTLSNARGYKPTHGMPFWSAPQVWSRPEGEPKRRPNIILISLDTLRPDHLSTYGYERETSPNLDRWAQSRGVVFETAIAPSPWTLPSHVSMLTGQGVLEHGYNQRRTVSDEVELLGEMLLDNGYRTLAMTGGGHVSPKLGWSQGFETFSYWPPGVAPVDEIETVFQQGLDWLEGAEERPPFFLFLHSYETHSPFIPRQPYFSRFAPDLEVPKNFLGTVAVPTDQKSGFQQRKWFVQRENNAKREGVELSEADLPLVIASYDSSVAHADAQVGRLLDALAETGLERETVVVLTSDHGEALGEKRLAGHSYLWDFNLRVPLILALPGTEQTGSRVKHQVRLEDVTPTLLDVADITPEPRLVSAMTGTSLLPLIGSERAPFPTISWSYASTSNYGLSLRRNDGLKFILNNTAYRAAGSEEALFEILDDDLDSERQIEDSAQSQELRQQAIDHLARNSFGIEIQLHNPTDEPFDGAFHTPSVQPSQFKSWDVPAGNFVRYGDGITLYKVLPGETYRVLIEGLPQGYQKFYVYHDETRLEFDLASLEYGQVLGGRRDETGDWLRSDGAIVPDAASVSMTRVGQPPVATGDEPLDEDLARQLEALGYI